MEYSVKFLIEMKTPRRGWFGKTIQNLVIAIPNGKQLPNKQRVLDLLAGMGVSERDLHILHHALTMMELENQK